LKSREKLEFGEEESRVKFPIPKTVKFDRESIAELELIVMFERKSGISTVIRDWVTEKIRTYQRNPQYLRFKKQLKKKEES